MSRSCKSLYQRLRWTFACVEGCPQACSVRFSSRDKNESREISLPVQNVDKFRNFSVQARVHSIKFPSNSKLQTSDDSCNVRQTWMLISSLGGRGGKVLVRSSVSRSKLSLNSLTETPKERRHCRARGQERGRSEFNSLGAGISSVISSQAVILLELLGLLTTGPRRGNI